MSVRFHAAEAVAGISLLKFTLTYDGKLPSNGSPKKKWEIRSAIHPQLVELWQIDKTLLPARRRRYIPKGSGFFVFQGHHSEDNERVEGIKPPEGPYIDLCEPIKKGDYSFFPLIRNSFNLKCALKVQFLRKEPPGRVYQGGDLDNRIKTLFDALQIPNIDQLVKDQTVDQPIYCLLEDDSLITGLEVSTHRLLSKPNSEADEVRLIIDVDVRVIEPRTYNQIFLGE
jgi:hypothetical protein